MATARWRGALRQFAQPEWNGAPLADQTLLVYAEQGLGDTLQFIRYVPLIAERCRKLIVEVPERLIPLLERSGFRDLVPQGGRLPAFDVQMALMSAPHVLKTSWATIPGGIPYLTADAGLIGAWRTAAQRV